MHHQHALTGGKVIAHVGKGAVHHAIDGADQPQIMQIETGEAEFGPQTLCIRPCPLRLSRQGVEARCSLRLRHPGLGGAGFRGQPLSFTLCYLVDRFTLLHSLFGDELPVHQIPVAQVIRPRFGLAQTRLFDGHLDGGELAFCFLHRSLGRCASFQHQLIDTQNLRLRTLQAGLLGTGREAGVLGIDFGQHLIAMNDVALLDRTSG